MTPSIDRLLLVRLSALGDCVHAVPVAEEIRRQLPGVELGWAIEEPGHRLLGSHPAVDRFHIYPRSASATRLIPALWALRRELRSCRYQVAIDVQGLTKSGLVAWLSGAPRRIGFAGAESREANRWFLTERVGVPDSARHVVDRNLAVLGALGLEVPERGSWSLLEAASADAASGSLQRWLDDRGEDGMVLLNVGAAWPTKVWSADSFAQLASQMVARWSVELALTYGNAEEERQARDVVERVAHPRVLLAPPTDLGELRALLREARLFVGSDTGPMHLAVALGVPTVALFGPTDPERNGPYGIDDLVVRADAELDCRPCQSRSCHRGDLACMERIGPAQVLAACERRLASAPGSGGDDGHAGLVSGPFAPPGEEGLSS